MIATPLVSGTETHLILYVRPTCRLLREPFDNFRRTINCFRLVSIALTFARHLSQNGNRYHRLGGDRVGGKDDLRQALIDGARARAWGIYAAMCLDADAEPMDAETHYLGGRAAVETRNLHAARRALEHALAAGATGTMLGKVRVVLGEVLRRLGELNLAQKQLESFLQNSADYPALEPVWRAIAWRDLGLVYRQQRHLDDALTCFRAAADEARAANLDGVLGRALRNAAWICCLLDDPDSASVALDEAAGLYESQADRWDQHLGRAHEAAARGDAVKLSKLCSEIFSAAESAVDRPPVNVLSHAACLVGREALRQGDLAVTETMAQRAVDWGAQYHDDSRPLIDGANLLREVRLRRHEMDNQAAGA